MSKNLLKVWPKLCKIDKKYRTRIIHTVDKYIEQESLTVLGRHISANAVPLMPRNDFLKVMFECGDWDWFREMREAVENEKEN